MGLGSTIAKALDHNTRGKMRRDRGLRSNLVFEPSASFTDTPPGGACAKKKNRKATNAHLWKGE